MMKASKPDISAPLSRAKKSKDGGQTTLLLGGLTAVALIVLLIYSRMQGKSMNSKMTSSLLRKAASFAPPSAVVIETQGHGDIEIQLRPNLSPESVDYILQIVEAGACDRCKFYRSEKDLLLQGIITTEGVQKVQKKGDCPPELQGEKQDCPSHDPNCACHGPTMTKGMVGWAAGGTGFDFFIDTFKDPVKWWGQQHTVWGEVVDEASLNVIYNIYTLPVKKSGGLWMLDDDIHFTVRLK